MHHATADPEFVRRYYRRRVPWLLTITFGAMLLASGCTTAREPLSPTLGQAAKANFEAMVDDPRPLEGDPVPDARVIDGAIDRYQQDEVKPPRTSDDYRTTGGSGG